MTSNKIINWLLKGDISIQYQVYRDLLLTERPDLQEKIAQEGWGARFLSKRKDDGHWGRGFYQPKWVCSHYTLLDLRNLAISPKVSPVRESVAMILKTCKAKDGGIYPMATKSDVCVNGMFLNYASYFGAEGTKIQSVIDMLLKEHMPDGGFNCRSNRSGAVHSSLHSTLSVAEGMTEYLRNGYSYRKEEVEKAIQASQEMMLLHQLYISDRSGEIIHKDFLKFSYPRRWRYDVLSALDYFRYARFSWDKRLRPGVEVLLKKRNKENIWKARAKYSGQTHFDMEKAGKASRWNTLRALRVLRFYGLDASIKT